MLLASLIAVIASIDGPVEFGQRELSAALDAAGLGAVSVQTMQRSGQQGKPETFLLEFRKGSIRINGAENNGAMYGLLEAAERIRNSGKDAWKQRTVGGSPYLADRGWNIFLPLPWDYEKNFVDNDPAALTDPKRWFFMDDDYWRTLFDQMARSRLNWLDIHGPYDLDTTRFPNLYAYFIQSDKFPKVGVAPEIKATLLKQLNHVVEMAHARGIRVSLMSYEARFDVPHNPNPGYKGDEPEIYEYTREVVEKMIRQCPGLDKIGFRIGESGRGPEFFKCYLEAVKASGRDIPVYTRSWTTRKARVVPLARQSKDFTVEIKYNGEHWGAPYIMAGGRTAGWYSYFFEDYLSDSGSEKAERMWPGNPAEVGSSQLAVSSLNGNEGSANSQLPTANRQLPTSWPSQPYKIVWQVRANGTHRIFPFYQPEWTRRSILSMKLGTASGYTIESMASYFPQEPRYYMNVGVREPARALGAGEQSADRSAHSQNYRWIHQRDEMYMACWGRFGYDPTVPEWKFDRMVMRRFGDEVGQPLTEAWKAASKAVPISFMARSLGPDHRSHAPELEWGGDTETYLQTDPFDSHVFMSKREELALKATGGIDGRLRSTDAYTALGLSMKSPQAGRAFSAPNKPQRLMELQVAIQSLRELASYHRCRIRGLRYVAGFEDPDTTAAAASAGWMGGAFADWNEIGLNDGSNFYRPFTDRLRMHTHEFNWQQEATKIGQEAKRLTDLAGGNSLSEFSLFLLPNPQPPSSAIISVAIDSEYIRCSMPADGISRAWLLEKPLPSSTLFHKTPMQLVGNAFVAQFKRKPWGHCVAAEVELANGTVRRIPWWEKERPYLVVPSQQQPTPTIYSSEEALSYLKPEILDPDKYGWMIVGFRGWNFHRRFDIPTQRKLLRAVERGMNLLVMQQDYVSGRYPLDWLPMKPKVVDRRSNVFDPAGALEMPKIETADILWQPFEAGNGWEVFGNGGVARLKYGKGEIWMVQARLIQRMHIPNAARTLLALLKACCPEDNSLSLEGEGRGVGERTSNFPGQSSGPNVPGRSSSTPQPPPSKEGGPNRKTAILIDTGSEGADYVTSVIPDFMNAHDLPFLTLGEVIAKEQGMDSTTVIPGPKSDDMVLDGKGPEMMKAWLETKVKRLAARPLPKTKQEVEARKPADRKEFMRMMGMDPLPKRTPLNARITGIIQRPGYRIEKLVYESRPGFFVTAHIYFPEPGERSKAEGRRSNNGTQVEGRGSQETLRGARFEVRGEDNARDENPKSKISRRDSGTPSEQNPKSGSSFDIRPSTFPVILNAHGHWPVKKQTEVVQSRCIFQALHGYVAMVVDTPGHSFEADNAPIERRWQGNHNDWFLLLGSANTTALYAWDIMRGLDYLETRPECDTKHVGITGASGGGLGALYTFVADERIDACVPVVYATSLEVNPNNGCLCNHVPGTLQVGDRSDLLAIRAPKPVLVIGAQVDSEFPPEGTKRTGEKLRAIWKLYGKEDDAQWKVFPGGHDYSKPMRELAMGFFDKHLKGMGDGSPVPEPEFATAKSGDPELLVLKETPTNAKTQRDIARERLASASKRDWSSFVKLNGGLPKGTTLRWDAHDARDSQKGQLPFSGKSFITYQPEEGLTIPAVAWGKNADPKAILILISENGKTAASMEFGVDELTRAGFDCIAIDVRGFGELQGLDQRLMTYLGSSIPFAQGWDAAVAARNIIDQRQKVIVVGKGPVAAQAAMFAALFEPRISAVVGLDGLKEFSDCFERDVPPFAITPRADLAPSLSALRSFVKPKSFWTFYGDRSEISLPEILRRLLAP